SQLSSPEDHVLDFDVQLIVNSLWAAGAEAISINDRRLAFGTAIRSAGEAILVDLEPVTSPYRIIAIGEPDRLTRSFSETPGASHLKLLHSNFRIGSSITQHARVDLPAGNAMRLNYAEPEANLADGEHGTLKGEEENYDRGCRARRRGHARPRFPNRHTRGTPALSPHRRRRGVRRPAGWAAGTLRRHFRRTGIRHLLPVQRRHRRCARVPR